MLEEQGYAQSQRTGWVVENTDVEPAENIGYFELLAIMIEKKDVLTSIQINFQTF